MCECGMSDGFEPVSVLKGYVKDSRDAAERVCKEDKYSLKSQNARLLIKKVEERVEELERQKAQRKRNVEPPQPKPKGRKRPRDRSARGGILGPYMNPVAAGLYGSAAIPQPVYYGQQAGFVMPPFHPSYYSQ
ncbi:hypothetical protein Bca101_032294 [Brassica carinata]